MKPKADTIAVVRPGLFLCAFALIGFAQLSASITGAATLPPEDRGSSLSFASSSALDGLDGVTSDGAGEESLQIVENSPDLPNDLDEISLPSEDKAVIPSRDQQTPHFTTTTLVPITVHQPGYVPAFLSSIHTSVSLAEHICERAPPGLA